MIELASLDDLSHSDEVTVGVIMSSYNRSAVTLRALRSLAEQETDTAVSLAVVLVDDASDDGTPARVRECFPRVHIVEGSGALYWGGATKLGQQVMTDFLNPDYLLWLNDDVVLFPDALNALLSVGGAQAPCIVVGALQDSLTQETTYGGLRRVGRSPLHLRRIDPSNLATTVDTFNGNVVLIPREAYVTLGTVDAAFPHMYGDLDYGYRASSAGIAAIATGRHVGVCKRNDRSRTWQDASLSRRERLRELHSPKAMQFRPRYEFVRRHSGVEWPFRLLAGYAKAYWAVLRSAK